MSTFASREFGGYQTTKTVGAAVVVCLGLYAARARAEPTAALHDDDPKEATYLLSVRPSFGLGAGNLGLGGRLGVMTEYWLSDVVGVGVDGGMIGQSRLFGPQSSAMFVGPHFGVRSSPRGAYFVGALGAGYAAIDRSDGDGLCLLGPCAPAQSHGYDGYSIRASAGWLGHPGGSYFEIGPVITLDAWRDFRGQTPGDYLVTINLEVGFALPGR